MLVPRHVPIVDQVTLRSIRHAVNAHLRRFGLQTSLRDDLVQELTLHLIERAPEYDPSLGAWSTFVKCVVRNKLASIRRASRTEKQHAAGHVRSLNRRVTDCDGRAAEFADLVEDGAAPRRRSEQTRSHECQGELRSDIEALIDRLEVDLRRLCRTLLTTRSISEACIELRISRPTAYRRMQAVRELFVANGVHEYLWPSRTQRLF